MVVNSTQNINLDTKKLVYFAMEPHMDNTTHFKQYRDYLRSNPLMFWGDHPQQLNNVEWHLSPSCKDFLNPLFTIQKKYDRVLSVVVSNKYFDEGHILRLNFIKELDKRATQGTLPFELHVYGENSSFHNYKGTLPKGKKDDGIFPYKYHFNAENNSIKNYITEKFTDGIMGECILFYWGCPNVDNYYNKDSYIRLSLQSNDIESDIQIISKAMDEDLYTKRLPVIKETKLRIMKIYNLFPRLKSIIQLSKCLTFINLESIDQTNVNQTIIQSIQQKCVEQSLINSVIIKVVNYSAQNLFDFLSQSSKHNTDILYVSKENELEDIHTKLWKSITYYREIEGVEPDIIILTENDTYSIGLNGSFYIRQKGLENIVNKLKEENINNLFKNLIIKNLKVF